MFGCYHLEIPPPPPPPPPKIHIEVSAKYLGLGQPTVIKTFQSGINAAAELTPNFIEFPDTRLENAEAIKNFHEC